MDKQICPLVELTQPAGLKEKILDIVNKSKTNFINVQFGGNEDGKISLDADGLADCIAKELELTQPKCECEELRTKYIKLQADYRNELATIRYENQELKNECNTLKTQLSDVMLNDLLGKGLLLQQNQELQEKLAVAERALDFVNHYLIQTYGNSIIKGTLETWKEIRVIDWSKQQAAAELKAEKGGENV